MAYNKRNRLLRIIDIQEITLKKKRDGYSQQWIYSKIIKEIYHISESTFSTYLGINAKHELKQLEEEDAT